MAIYGIFKNITDFIKSVKKSISSVQVTDEDIRSALASYMLSDEYMRDVGHRAYPKVIGLVIPAGSFEVDLKNRIALIVPGTLKLTDNNSIITFSMKNSEFYCDYLSLYDIDNTIDSVTDCIVLSDKILFNSKVSKNTSITLLGTYNPVSIDTDFSDDAECNLIIEQIPVSFRFLILYSVCLKLCQQLNLFEKYDQIERLKNDNIGNFLNGYVANSYDAIGGSKGKC